MRKRNRKSVFIGAILIMIAVAVTVYLFAVRSYTPLETIATKTPLPGEAEWYDWISENEFLVAIRGRQSFMQTIKKWNVTSDAAQNLDGVTHKIASLNSLDVDSLSPDHKWLLCIGFQGKKQVYYAVSMSGSACPVFDREGIQNGVWFPDSSRWVGQVGFGSPVSLTAFPCNSKDKPFGYRFPVVMELPHFMGFARNGNTVIVDYWIGEYYEKVVACQYRYGTPQKIRQDTITFPFTGKMNGMEIDPHGDRMLWQLEVELDQAHPAWLRRVLRYLRRSSTSKSVTLFYICKVDGSDGKIAGYVDSTEVEQPRWLPSGTKFSFMVGNSLWLVPVP